MCGANVLIGLEQHQIDLGGEEAAEGDRGGDVDTHAHTRDLYLQGRPSARLYMLTNSEKRVYKAQMCGGDLFLCFANTDLVIVVGAEVDGYEGQPDDARRIHGEADVLGLVEVLRDLARLERVQGTHQDQEHVVDEGHHQRKRRHAARQHRRQGIRMDLCGVRRFDHQPHDSADELDCSNPYANRTNQTRCTLK